MALTLAFATVASAATPGSQAWLQRWNGPAGLRDEARAIAVSPDGSHVYVTGTSAKSGSVFEYATIAYDATSGKRLWVSRRAGKEANANAVTVSPDGTRVFVTGTSASDFATVAYRATTGAELWFKRYDGPKGKDDGATAIALTPNGKTVVVTGYSKGANRRNDYATVAYDSATGARRWVSRYEGPGKGEDFPTGISVSGTRAFVTGASEGLSATKTDYATIAYNLTDGSRAWLQRYNGPQNGNDGASAIGLSPDRKTVFITGGILVKHISDDEPDERQYATLAYDATSGARKWVKRYGSGQSDATAVAVHGDAVFVTGIQSAGNDSGGSASDYATVAYRASDGTQLWATRYGFDTPYGHSYSHAAAIGVASDGTRVFVTGSSLDKSGESGDDYATVAYRSSDGAQMWLARYNGPGDRDDNAQALAVNDSMVFVTGSSLAGGTGWPSDWATIAYRTK